MANKQHAERIHQELQDAGMTPYGFLKLSTGHLPSIIHEDEHVKGVVYGRLDGTMLPAMLVATDRRVIFLDARPFYRNWDEITYEVVAGVKTSMAGPFVGIVLHTRVKDYALRYVNMNCAKKFVACIEEHIEKRSAQLSELSTSKKSEETAYQSYKIQHDKPSPTEHKPGTVILDDTAVLSTANKAGKVHASVIHYLVDKDENFYFLTKSDTQKVKYLEENKHVALTIHPSQSMQVLYVKGMAKLVENETLKQQIFEHIIEPKHYTEGVKLPPITKIKSGVYIAYKINVTDRKQIDYSKESW